MINHDGMPLDQKLGFIPSVIEPLRSNPCPWKHRLLRPIWVAWVEVVVREQDAMKFFDIIGKRKPSFLLRVRKDAPEQGRKVRNALLVLGHICRHVLHLGTSKDDKSIRRTIDVTLGFTACMRIRTVAAQGERAQDGSGSGVWSMGRL